MSPNASQTVRDVVNLKRLSDDAYQGPVVETMFVRTFGGQVVAQALRAAQLTVKGKNAHSLHTYFLEGGVASEPIDFHVERIRDGHSFAARRVEGFQNGKRMVIMSVNFHHDLDVGPEHADRMPKVAGPQESIDHLSIRPQAKRKRQVDWADWDIRVVPEETLTDSQLHPNGEGTHQYLWFRNTSNLGLEQGIHQAALAYLSDMTLLYTTLLDHPRQELQTASLDHAMWFARPVSVDDWLLVDQYSPSASSGLGLAQGKVYNQSGNLVAVLSQEGLIRAKK